MKVEKYIAYPYIRKEENKSIFIQVNFVMQTDGQSWQRDFIWKVDEPLNKEEENEFLKILDEKYIEFDAAARKKFVENCKDIFPELLRTAAEKPAARNCPGHPCHRTRDFPGLRPCHSAGSPQGRRFRFAFCRRWWRCCHPGRFGCGGYNFPDRCLLVYRIPEF